MRRTTSNAFFSESSELLDTKSADRSRGLGSDEKENLHRHLLRGALKWKPSKNSMISRSYISIALALFALSCADGVTSSPVEEPPPELILEGITYRYYEGSTLTMSGKARASTYRNTTGAVTADELFTLLLDDATGAIEARANRVLGNVLLKWADAEAGVELFDINDTRAKTERASFDGRRQRFFGETPVAVFGEGFQASADSGFSLALKGDRVLHFQGPILSQIFTP